MSNKLEYRIKTIDEFIQDHTHIAYCEAIILSDGTITYAVPSHTEALIRLYQDQSGLSRKDIEEEIMVDTEFSSVLLFLINKTNSIAVWFNMSYFNSRPTKKQIESIDRLIKSKLVKW